MVAREVLAPAVPPPAILPTSFVPEDTDPIAVGQSCIHFLHNLQPNHLTPSALWRDLFSLTGTSRTFHDGSTIVSAFKTCCGRGGVTTFQLQPQGTRVARFGPNAPSWVDVRFEFEISSEPACTCAGVMSLVPDGEGGWKIWMLTTWIEQLKGEADVDRLEPVTHSRTNGHATAKGHDDHEEGDYDCIVVGAGQSGLSTAGRMKALGINVLVLDRHPRVGDNWRNRYDSVKLHTPRNYCQLPFERIFTPDDGEWLPKDAVGNGYERWAKKYGINISLSSTVLKASWNEQTKVWTLDVDCQGTTKQLTCPHLFLALGPGSHTPHIPTLPNRSLYTGTVLHSSTYKTSTAWTGLHGLVIGAANTAHDVASDMVLANLASVTLIQRSPSWILPRGVVQQIMCHSYNDTLPIEVGDRAFNTVPLAVARDLANGALAAAYAREPNRYDGLQAAGFRIDWKGDLIDALYNKYGGHYLEHGTAAQIAAGDIKVKSGILMTEFTEKGVKFEDGEEVEADVVVFCTGFQRDMSELCRGILGDEVLEKVGRVWGLDGEGEPMNAWKSCGYPGLWFGVGDTTIARFSSRFLALQVKAQLLRRPFVPFLEFRKG